NGDVSFPMASTYKIAMAAYGLSQVDAGTLSLQQMVVLQENQRVVSSPLNRYLPYAGVSVSLQNLLFLMLTESDNTATDLFLETIGGAAAVTAWLGREGISPMRVDRSTAQLLRQYAGLPEPQPGESYFDQYETALAQQQLKTFSLDGSSEPYLAFEQDPQDQATPAAMNDLLLRLWKGELLSASSTQLLKDIMLRCNTGNERIKGMLPAGTLVAHKTGTITGTLNDVGVVTLPNGKGHLLLSIFVKNAVGPWQDHERVIAEIARASFDYFIFSVVPAQ
ncbi:MAG TPA: serine hydrolase, partial [Xanthomonadales bacterium]|nr:serine hydrolase [Xanthomonadales bacterium]